MTNQQHNGWTNYATWRVQLEYFADRELDDFTGGRLLPFTDLYALLRDHVEEIIDIGADPGSLVHGWANAFIDEVNWSEIADHLLEADEAKEDTSDS